MTQPTPAQAHRLLSSFRLISPIRSYDCSTRTVAASRSPSDPQHQDEWRPGKDSKKIASRLNPSAGLDRLVYVGRPARPPARNVRRRRPISPGSARMKQVMVRYKAKPEHADENARLI